MKVQEGQSFLSLYLDPGTVEIARGGRDSFAHTTAWERNGSEKTLGQVGTPLPIARLMAEWVTESKPRTVLDPAVGLGNLLHACRQYSSTAELIGIDRDEVSFRHALQSSPEGTKLIRADYLRHDLGLIDGIVANPLTSRRRSWVTPKATGAISRNGSARRSIA